MTMLLVQFIVVCAIAGIALWALQQFPTLDATVVKLIRIAVFVVLSLLLVNLILVALFNQSLTGILRA